MIDTILKLYRPDPPRFRNISSLASELGWTNVAAQTSLEYLRSFNVDDLWTLEFVEALTRLNYGQVAVIPRRFFYRHSIPFAGYRPHACPGRLGNARCQRSSDCQGRKPPNLRAICERFGRHGLTEHNGELCSLH